MRNPSVAWRRFGMAAIGAAALLAAPATAGAQEPITRLHRRRARSSSAPMRTRSRQKASARRTMGRNEPAAQPAGGRGWIDTPGVRRAQEISIEQAAVLRPGRSHAGLRVLAIAGGPDPGDADGAVHAGRSPRGAPFSWHEHFEDVITGYNAYSPSGDVSARSSTPISGCPGLRGARRARGHVAARSSSCATAARSAV